MLRRRVSFATSAQRQRDFAISVRPRRGALATGTPPHALIWQA
jgi:hypothetical protein